MMEQPDLPFANAPSGDGYERWAAQRSRAQAEARHSLHLPIGSNVEVWLRGGVRLRGTLRMSEWQDGRDVKAAELSIGNVAFRPWEIDSCVRIG